MANSLYTTFKNQLMGGTIDLDTDVIKVALLDSTYIVNLTTDFDYTTHCSASEIDTGTLTGKTISSGVFNAANHEFLNVTHGSNAKYIVIYVATGQLITYFDTDSNGVIDIPCIGNDIQTEWNASGILAFAGCP